MNEQKQGKPFGWVILGFFFPLVGLILFFVFKNKKSGASKASGLGALIGFLIQLLITIVVCLISFGFIRSNKITKVKSEGIAVTMKKYENSVTLSHEYDIKEYHYEADWVDKIYEFYDLDKKVVTVLNTSGDVVFKIEAEKKSSTSEDFEYYVILNNKRKVKIKETILLLVGSFDFYYTEDLLIFNAGLADDEVYFYDYKQDTLVTAFSRDDLGNEGLYVTNIKLNENKDLIIDTYVNAIDSKNLSTGKSVVVLGYDNGAYKTLEDLQTALNKYNLEDFILKQEYTHKKEANGYELNSSVVETTIIEDFKKGSGVTTSTKECTGKISQGSNKNEYVLFSQQRDYPQYDDCASVTFKLNDDFTIKYQFEDANGVSHGIYINNKKYDSVDFQGKYYIAGKTLVASKMHQTTVNGGYSTALINTNGEIYNFAANTQGRDTNKLDTEGKEDTSFVVNDKGELVITATKINNNIDTDYLGMYAQKDTTCNLSVDKVASAYNTTTDGDYITEYTYKTTSDGLVNFNYASKKTTQTIKEAYKEFCK